MIEEGTILQNRYRIGKHIGQGGMGTVYLATDERFGSTVAIKETLFSDDHFKKAFKREARLLNSLKHSALPKVSDHFIEKFGQYIVMEYIGGDDLYETMEKRGKSFSVGQVLDWARQLLDALEYLHGQENPIIHRDIKPQNLKLTSQGQIVLLDFGLAKGNPTDANYQTAANSIFGYSRNYASLEQIQGTGTDPRSDLYSLAATLYHLVTGKPPADALTRVMMVLNEEKDPLQPPNEIHKAVPDDLSGLLMKTMSLNANQRPQSANEMRRLLDVGGITRPISDPLIESEGPRDTNFFSKETKVMPVDSGYLSKTEKETVALPVASGKQGSFVTKIAGPPTDIRSKTPRQKDTNLERGLITRSFSNRSQFTAALAAGILILVGSVAAGVYLLNPGIFSPSSSAVDIENREMNGEETSNSMNPEIPEPVETPDLPLLTEQDGESPGEDADPMAQEATKTPQKSQSDEKSRRMAEQSRVNNGSEKGVKSGDVQVSTGEVITKDVTVSDSKVETKDVTIGSRDIRTRDRTDIPPKPPISREEFERLSPEQKVKVRRSLERWRQIENQRRKRRGLPPIPKPPTLD